MKFSIILPVYNVEQYISKSVQSILDQTYRDFELLVIIDGSPDNSIDIVRTFQDSRISIYEKANGGLSDARNFGLNFAKGEFILFLDSDDWISSDLLQDALFHIEKNEIIDILIFGYHLDNEDLEGNLNFTRTIYPNNREYKRDNINKVFDKNLLNIFGYAWNKVYNLEFLKTNGLVFDKGISLVEDILFNVRAYLLANRIITIDRCHYHYIDRPVLTLVKSFHNNSFDLILKKHKALEVFFNNWHVTNANEILAFSLVQGIRYCVYNMIQYGGGMSFKEKQLYIHKMLNDYNVTNLISSYNPEGYMDVLYKNLIKYKQSYLITLLSSIKK